MTSALAVVVPNFNGAAILHRTLAALAAQTVQACEVLVVDNGSTDGSADAAERDFPWIRVERVGWNSGFGAAANRGVRSVAAPLVAVLNSDARPSAEWVERMTGFEAGAPPSAWSWGAVLTTPQGLIESAGDCYSVAGFAYKHAQGQALERLPLEPFEVFAPPGAAPVFRREVFLELQGYDERYFLYLEDIDLAFRARSRGFASWLVPGATVEHDLGASGSSCVATWHVARNAIWCQVVNSPDFNPRMLVATSRREFRDARARGCGAAYVRGRAAALPRLPSLLAARARARSSRLVDQSALRAACTLPGRWED